MSADPILRLPKAFGSLLSRWLRDERRLTYQAAAAALDLPDEVAVVEMECGKREPTLTQIFKLAAALHDPPAILLIDILAEWRKDPSEIVPYKTRASDPGRLYRLGYHRGPGDFRELPRVYGGMDEATGVARTLSAARRKRGVVPLDTVLIYARVGYVVFRPDEEERP